MGLETAKCSVGFPWLPGAKKIVEWVTDWRRGAFLLYLFCFELGWIWHPTDPFSIRPTTFLTYYKFTDLLILRLWKSGRIGRAVAWNAACARKLVSIFVSWGGGLFYTFPRKYWAYITYGSLRETKAFFEGSLRSLKLNRFLRPFPNKLDCGQLQPYQRERKALALEKLGINIYLQFSIF